MDRPTFSIVLPFYRQSDQIASVLDEFCEQLNRQPHPYELIAVVNGVADLPTSADTRVLREEPRITEIRLRNAGWGLAVKTGLAAARGEFVCYTNTARTKIDELLRMLAYARISDAVVVKATRIVRSSRIRKWTSILYNLENRIVLGTPIWDVNATPKVIPRKILERIPLESDGDLIDAELMVKCFRASVPIIEIPIQHMERRNGKSTTTFRSALKMFAGLIALKLRL